MLKQRIIKIGCKRKDKGFFFRNDTGKLNWQTNANDKCRNLKKNPICTQQFYFECDSFFSILLRWFTEEIIGYGFAFVFFYKKFKQITMVSYFIL